MDLRTYFTQRDGKVSRTGPELNRVAAACDVTPGFLYQVALDLRTVSSELACHLEYATGGYVNRRETLPEFPWDRPAVEPEKVRATG